MNAGIETEIGGNFLKINLLEKVLSGYIVQKSNYKNS